MGTMPCINGIKSFSKNQDSLNEIETMLKELLGFTKRHSQINSNRNKLRAQFSSLSPTQIGCVCFVFS